MLKTRFRLLLMLTVLLAPACQTEFRQANIDQDKYIDSYVSKNFADNPVYVQGGSVRVVLTEGAAGAPVIEKGDSVYLFYAGYVFGQNGPETQFVLDSGMVCVGKGKLIRGLDDGLSGARLGEEALVIFSGDDGYGNDAVGLVPANSALLFDVGVGAIKKNQ
jgi:FKBP-type peptidyl-prolyl cis-trans isomerase